MKNKRIVIIGMLVLFAFIAVAATAEAKSLYVNKDLNANSPISAYDIQGPPNYLVYQMTSLPTRYGGVGLGIDTDSEILFVTFEGYGDLDIVDAKTLNKLGAVIAPGAYNLAGIVVDQDKAKVYTVDRSTDNFYIYSWDAFTKTLTLDNMINLPGIYFTGYDYGFYGIALDEVHDLLYAADMTNIVKIFHTDDWSAAGNITFSQQAMSVAVDVENGFVYTGNAYPPYGGLGLLCKYNLITDTETTKDIRALTGDSTDNVVGIAVDPATSLVYITTGNQGYGGTDQMMVFDSNLNKLYETGSIGSPTGITIPGKEISYNPLNLTKDDGLEQGACISPGQTINYTICFENTNPFIIHNVSLIDTLPADISYESASDGATYNATNHKVTWQFATIPASSSQYCVWLRIQVNLTIPPGTKITNHVIIDSDETPPTTISEETNVCEGGADTTPPLIYKTIGNPQYDGGLWVNFSTPITLTATDPGDDASGVKEIHYKINGVETVVQDDEVTFTFQEECTHTLEFWAVDNAGNEGDHTTQTHYVDDTGPVQTIQFGTPKDEFFVYHDGNWFTGIGAMTPIWINSTDGGCNGGVGSNYLCYNVYNGLEYGEWTLIESHTIYDNQAGDSNPAVGKISVLTNMDESCWHEIHYWCYDLLGNREPVGAGSFLNADFVVDATAPTTQIVFGTPHMVLNDDDYISCGTPITIYANDTGCRPGGAGAATLVWSVDKKMNDGVWQEIQSGTVNDNDANDLDQTVGKIKYIIYMTESCEHHIYAQATDYFGNAGPQLKKYVKVDCTPPITIKEIGQPQYYNSEEDITYVTTHTPIWLNTTDQPGNCSVGCEYLHWEIYIYNETSQGWDLLSSDDAYSNKAVLYFGEECHHKLVWWAIDKFGNQEETHVQYHNVDDTPPTTIKQYGSPQCFQQDLKLAIEDGSQICITSHTPIYLNATDGGLCAVGSYIIYYRVWYNGQWSDWLQGEQTTNVVVTMDDLGAPFNQDCWHFINYYAVDDLMNTEEIQNQSFYVDNTPPVIVKTVGDPNCTIDEDEYCILPTTPITIDAYNDGCCADTGLTLRYKINDGDWIYPTYLPVIITINESCTHILTVEAWDCLGNIATDVETFHVDVEPPTMTKTVGDPHCDQGEGTYCVTMQTPITVEATDQGCAIPCGPVTIQYNITYAGQWTGWTNYTGAIYFSEPCEHTLVLRAFDCLENGMDDQYWDTETFYVDNTTPVIEKTVGEPQCDLGNGTYCVTTQTDITINAYDKGCCNDLTVKYRINEGDWMDITSLLPFTFNFTEECQHTLDIWAYDCVGHEIMDTETFYVDNTPPIINKTVGEPNCFCGNDTSIWYCVTTNTPITVEALNDGCCPCTNNTIEYRIWFDGQWSDWMTYTEPIMFEEQCTHQLEIRAMDCLGNTATDLETFYVDETPPVLTKTVGNPHFYLGVDEAGHDVWNIGPLTPISFASEATGCCPCLNTTIYYRYWYLGEWTDWMIYDEPITFHKGCTHYLEAYAVDCLGNQGIIDNETFWVCTSGEAGPTVTFINPELGSTYCERTLDVKIQATDDITPSSELTVKIWIPGGRRNAPTFWYDTVYNETDGYFHAFIDLYEYQNGAELTLEGWAVDEDGYANFALPVTFVVCSNVGYDQWHQIGWNSLTIPWGEISCSYEVTDVLGSIDGNYAWVWYYDAVHDQWSSWYKYRDPGFNTLTMMEPGKQYWVYMETADRYFTDIYAPMVTITYPENGAVFNTTITSITGTAFDNESGIDYVTITLYSNSTGKYWDGDSWETTATDLLCTGTETWSYDTTSVTMTGGLYIVTATATDKVGCTGEDMHSFTIVSQNCVSTKTYTTDADFNEGTLIGINASNDQLQLISGEVTTYPVMWIANAGEDSISKWDTNTNTELARYHTWFGPLGYHGAWSGPAPSRTCVDTDGNCYVANRHFDGYPADVIKIYSDDWIDRNGNGVMDTCSDTNHNGKIDESEMYPITDTNGNNKIDPSEITDERVAWAMSIGPSGGIGRALAIDTDGNIWLGLYSAQQYYKLSSVNGSILYGPISVPITPYGALVDKYGILWGANLGYDLLRLDTHNYSIQTFYHGYLGSNYGIALGYDSLGNTHVYLGGSGYTYIEFNSSTSTFSTPAASFYYTNGIATDKYGNICAANTWYGGASKFAPNGSLIWTAPSQYSGEYSTVVDSNNDVWAIHESTSKLSKFNGTTGAPLGVFDTGLYPYTYSDATGLGLRTSVLVGTWTVIFDSQATDTAFNMVSWNSDVPNGSSIVVTVRSSNDLASWSPLETATNGGALSTTPPGRYLQIETTMKMKSGGTSPVLYDLTVDGTCAACTDNTPPVVNILDPLDGEMRTSSPSQLIIEAYDEESSVVDVYAKIHDATTNLFFNGTGWQDSEAWLFCTSDINDQWYLDTDWSDELNHTYHITAEAYDECGNIGTDMHTFTIIAEEQQAYSLSGTIYYTGNETGHLIIALFNQNPQDFNVTPIDNINKPEYEFPTAYTFSNLSSGTYYVAAHIDMNDNGGPPDFDEPQGFAINKTTSQPADALIIAGANLNGADVTLAIPPMNNAPVVDITYPEDDDWFNYSGVGQLTITGIAYDEDTYVDEVQVMLSYTDEEATTYYYNMSGWGLTPYSFTVGGTGSGTMADPLAWELIIEPGFPIEYYLYDVYATVYDHDAIPLMNSDANWFWYPEAPLPT